MVVSGRAPGMCSVALIPPRTVDVYQLVVVSDGVEGLTKKCLYTSSFVKKSDTSRMVYCWLKLHPEKETITVLNIMAE